MVILSAIFCGIIIHLLTYSKLKKKAHYMPGGAVCVAFFLSPWYISLPFALVGHIISVLLVKKFIENKKMT